MAGETSTRPPGTDPGQLFEMFGRLVADTAAAAAVTMIALGARSGLLAELAEAGPLSAPDLAARTGQHPAYVGQWARSLVRAGYLISDSQGYYTLGGPAGALLGDPDGPMYAADLARLITALGVMTDRVVADLPHGRGIPATDYPDELFAAIRQKDGNRLARALTGEWITQVAGLAERLRAGAEVIHVGCADGQAMVALARAFEGAQVTGYEQVPAQVEQARRAIEQSGLRDRLTLRETDPAVGLPPGQTLIMLFDVLHDAPDPLSLLTAVRAALAPDGVVLLLETNGDEHPPTGPDPSGALLYAISTLQNVPQALARDRSAEPLGMLGLPVSALTDLARAAGLVIAEKLAEPSPFNTLYLLEPESKE